MALTALAFVILLLTGQIGSQSSTPPSLNESSPPTSAHPDWVIGQTFEDGDLAFRILSYEDSLPSLVADGGEVAERGQWVVIQLEISNPGETERTFVPDVQEIVTNQGEIYPNEPASALRIAEPALGAKPIAPGDKQVGYMAFDIPIEAKPTELKLTSRVGEPALVIPLG
jgi:hypothetical protein